MNNVKKLLKLAVMAPQDNDLDHLASLLAREKDLARADWAAASQAIVNGYRDPKNPRLSAKSRAEIRRENSRLKRELKESKNRHDRLEKLETALAELRQKYGS